ncbi:metalloprotease JAMM1, desampylating [Natrialba magadii ATCC 43099]|uniref:Metalloprotease JAMM1, desampylating n=1 Tax=Natrialba magadii (strain ATCC 43099 / DSM 3394 / CCM 3739 / CIP 104546 / IAM 13178 / JCM 8861 / NBRC 102185 / NCIMB 2190 / MS3) TaxID=547559 RepID=D3STU1_NATMM|nr:desampylase [Natrialba magadii]ADD05108.1 metalloprotease JAMM1, desampylating [Natrialba magadii ATCC 43099]ELY23343.1 Mov34/MPN/PAD-1 family protein [Natrialba magadii ATCC 43099]
MTRESDTGEHLPADAADSEDQPTLVIPDSICEEICDHARDGAPEEICGILGGSFDANRSRVESSYPTVNVADTPRTRYRIDPEEQLECFERLEAAGEEIVGFYHTHPNGPARPSETDVEAATWPDRSYVIVSLEPFAVGSWRWRSGDAVGGESGGQFERERIIS